MIVRLALISLFALGCVGYPNYEADEPAPARESLGSATLTAHFVRYRRGEFKPHSPSATAKYLPYFRQLCLDSGFFDAIKGGSADFDVLVQVRSDYSGSEVLNTLAFFTAYVVPTFASSRVEVAVSISRGGEDTVLARAVRQFSYRSAAHILLLPFLFSNFEGGVGQRAAFSLLREGLSIAGSDLVTVIAAEGE